MPLLAALAERSGRLAYIAIEAMASVAPGAELVVAGLIGVLEAVDRVRVGGERVTQVVSEPGQSLVQPGGMDVELPAFPEGMTPLDQPLDASPVQPRHGELLGGRFPGIRLLQLSDDRLKVIERP